MVCYIYHKTCGAYMSEHKRKRKWMTHTNLRVYLLEMRYQSTRQDHNLLLLIFYLDVVTTGVRWFNRFLSLSVQLGQGSNQCLISHIIIRSRKVSNPWDLVLSVPVILDFVNFAEIPDKFQNDCKTAKTNLNPSRNLTQPQSILTSTEYEYPNWDDPANSDDMKYRLHTPASPFYEIKASV